MRTRFLWAAAAIYGGLIIFSCADAPTGARATLWVSVNTFPDETHAIKGLAGGDGGVVYAVGTAYSPDRGVVYRYDGTGITEVFVSPYTATAFNSVSSAGGEIWAVGKKANNGNTSRPYVVRNAAGRWEEVEGIPEDGEYGLRSVVRTTGGRIWMAGDKTVYTIEDGVWRTALRFDRPASGTLRVTENGRAFFYLFDGPADTASIFVSEDGGASWTKETLPRNYGFFTVQDIGNAVPAVGGERYYIAVRLRGRSGDEEILYNGILERDGAPPGEGSYEIVFMAPLGPYFNDIRDMAFYSETDGYAVGYLTSLARNDGEWVMEELPAAWRAEAWQIIFSVITASSAGYWAVGTPHDYQPPIALYRAPLGP